MNSVSLPKEQFVTLNKGTSFERTVRVKKLGLITYSKMATELKELIQHFLDLVQQYELYILDENSNEESTKTFIANMITVLIAKNVESMIKLLTICIPDLTYEYVSEYVGLDDFVNLLLTILEVNNINEVVTNTKNLIRSLQIQ